MTLPPHIAKLRDELAENLLNEPLICSPIYPDEVRAGYRLGFTAGFDVATAEAQVLVDAIRHTLGEFALYNEEEDANKWPKFIIKCEKNLAAYREKMGESK